MPIGLSAGAGAAIAGIVGGGAVVTSGILATHAANKAGDLNAHAATDQLAYLRQKDAQDQRNWETTNAENRRQFDSTQALNLDQYNKKEARLSPYRSIGAGATGTLADLMGIRMVPQPGGASLPPSSSAPPAPSASTGGPSGVDWNAPDDVLAQQLQSFFQTRGAANTEVPYWVQHRQELVARGKELNDPAYADKRLAAAEILGGGGAPAAPAAASSGLSKPFTVMPGSTAPDLSSLYRRTAPLSALGV